MKKDELRKKIQKEVDDNYEVFKKILVKNKDNMLESQLGKYALMKEREIKGYYSSWEDANQAGNLAYEDGIFSIQKVHKDRIDLGYFSHAVV